MLYVISVSVFTSVILTLVALLVAIQARVSSAGVKTVTINDDTDNPLITPSGVSLLSVLVDQGILLPSACGGKGTCGKCKCRVDQGAGPILPTELAHLNRAERTGKIRLACQLKVKDDFWIHVPPEIFSIKKFHATVVTNDNVASFIKELVLQLDSDELLNFRAGAYMQIDIPEYQTSFSDFQVSDRFKDVWTRFNLFQLKAKSDEPVFRAYSLANPPAEKNLLRFTIRIATPPAEEPDIPPGIGSSYLFNLKPGNRVTLSGPYGDFFVRNTDREMCFIGGGAGMAPMRSHIFNQLLEIGTHRRITFWYGARSLQELFYHDEFKSLESRFSNFSYHVALSEPQPEDHWTGLVGFIHQCALDQYLGTHPDPTEIEYYLCGPPPMIRAVNQMLYDLGVEPDMIAFDDFG
jgi:Na+-transporting NADH:ubiquinone oxidoreductase subunit F